MSNDVYGQLNTALDYHKAGILPEAEIIYRKILEQAPDNTDALNLLGMLLHQLKKHSEAVSFIARAIEIKPSAYFYKNLGNVYIDNNDIPNAIQSYKNALVLDSGDANLWFSIARAYKFNDNTDEAVKCYQKAVNIKPQFMEAYFNLGNIYKNLGNIDGAIQYYLAAIDIKPDDVDSHINIGDLYYEKEDFDNAVKQYQTALNIKPNNTELYIKLGKSLAKTGKIEDAINYFNIAIELKPKDDELYIALGNVFLSGEKVEEAIKCFKTALDVNPSNSRVYYNLGITYKNLNEFEKAESYYRKAIEINPDYIEAYNNLGVLLKDKGKIDEAITVYQSALKIKPDYPEANQNIGTAYLINQDFDLGWEKFEYGLTLKEIKYGFSKTSFGRPKWDGTSLEGKTIYIYYEREYGGGFGDSIQFIRYLELIYSQGAKILLNVQPELRKLFRQSNIKASILEDNDINDNLEFDVHCPLMSLPGIFRANPENIPFKEGYLKTDPVAVEKYKKEYFSNDNFKIGIVWSGNPKYLKNRFLHIDHFKSVCELSCVNVYSLQKGYGTEQLGEFKSEYEIVDLGRTFNDFSDTAAAIENLDLIITTDTSITHLSGALGKPTWILLTFIPEWRWLLDRGDSPWYNSVRLFRQKERGNWSEVMDRVAHSLKNNLL